MNKTQKNKLAEKSLLANFKNFILNFGIAIYWLIKSFGKILKQKLYKNK